jgi:hypothetical protein
MADVNPLIYDPVKILKTNNIHMDTDDFEAFNINANIDFNQDLIEQNLNDFKSEQIIPETDASYNKCSIQLPIPLNQGNNTT